MQKLKEEIRMKIIYPLTQPDLFKAYGKRAGGGILMYGPPGCGKTHLARATAGEVQAAFLSIGLHDVLDMYIGQSERNLHGVFELARSKAPCVLFFDEVDALGGNRADMRHNAMRQVINQLLSEMDGVDASNEGVLILAATNTPWYVDQALRRPGRFDRVLFIPPPDVMARDAILHLLLQGKPIAQIDYARLARETRDFSGADLRGAVDQAVEAKLSVAMRSGGLALLTTNDLLEAIHKQRPTTLEWFETARNYAVYANDGGMYDDVLAYLKIKKG
jgi:SpoVK/Ycf46/Vps4 family AAA+-type ATPase